MLMVVTLLSSWKKHTSNNLLPMLGDWHGENKKITTMKEVMHLFLLKTCDNKCPICCNNLYNIEEIPVVSVEELKEVHTVCFTGGEPFMYYGLNEMAGRIKTQYPNIKNIYAYTSGLSLLNFVKHSLATNCLSNIDGVSVSPKSKSDWEAFEEVFNCSSVQSCKSNRLYVFDKDKMSRKYKGFDVIGRTWDKVFKTPDNEIFRRLPILLD